MSSRNGLDLDCIEEASSTTSSCNDGMDYLNALRKYNTNDLSLRSTSTTDCVNLQNSNINIDNSNDVVIGSVAHFHGPVSIYQNQSEVTVEKLQNGGGETDGTFQI